MLVILDTNVLTADFEMRGVTFTAVLNSILLTDHRIAIPEVVLAEVINNYEQLVRDTASGIRQQLRKSRGTFPANRLSIPDDAETKSLVNDYIQRLKSRLSEYQVLSLPYPPIPHSNVVDRVLAGKRPFSKDDEGYRDMLVWRCVIESINLEAAWDGISFVSNDGAAFGDGKLDKLHPDLLEDICVELMGETVHWYRTLKEFMDDNLEMIGLSINEFISSFPEGEFEELIAHEITEVVTKSLSGIEVAPSRVGLPYEVENASILGVGEVEFIGVDNVQRTPDNLIVGETSLTVEANLLYYVFRADAVALTSEEHAKLSEYDNDHYLEGEDYRDLSVTVRFSFDPVKRKIVNIDPPERPYALDLSDFE